MPPLKHPGKRVGKSRAAKPQLELVPAVPVEAPAPERGWLKTTKEAWGAFWESPLAAAVTTEVHHVALRRLFGLYDERERAWRGFRKQRLVEGSQGQPVLNPLGKMLMAYDREINALEDRFGLTPKAGLALGVSLGKAAASLDALNGALNEGDDDEDADPRLANVIDASPPADARPAGM